METIPVWLVLIAIGFWKLRKQNDRRDEKLDELIRLQTSKSALPKRKLKFSKAKPRKLILKKV